MSGSTDGCGTRVPIFPTILGQQEKSMTLGDQQLRERCLEMALRQNTNDIVAEANRYFDFIKGEQSPRAKIDAALDQAGIS